MKGAGERSLLAEHLAALNKVEPCYLGRADRHRWAASVSPARSWASPLQSYSSRILSPKRRTSSKSDQNEARRTHHVGRLPLEGGFSLLSSDSPSHGESLQLRKRLGEPSRAGTPALSFQVLHILSNDSCSLFATTLFGPLPATVPAQMAVGGGHALLSHRHLCARPIQPHPGYAGLCESCRSRLRLTEL